MAERWHIELLDLGSVKGYLGGTIKDLKASGFEVLATVTVEKDVASVLGVHPFAGRAVFAFQASTGAVAGFSATIVPYVGRPRTLTVAQARLWVKSRKLGNEMTVGDITHG